MELNYAIKIYDTQDLNAVTILEAAENNTISLKYFGGDDKDKNIIGSALNYSMLAPIRSDAHFVHLYTNDERRYKVELVDEDTNIILWKGFIIPDQYKEPYTNGVLFIQFEANCGLASLKGYFLPESFYTNEHTIIEIIAKCLELTGLNTNFYFTPALVNLAEPSWETKWLDTSIFKSSSGKKKSAYGILELVLKNIGCTVYQEDGEFYVVGYNKRALSVYTLSKYNYLGNFIEDIAVTRNYTSVVAYATPLISITAPLKQVEVAQTNSSFYWESQLYKEVSDGWVDVNNENAYFKSRHWIENNGYFAQVNTSDNAVKIFTSLAAENPLNFISLKRKPYVLAGSKFEATFALELLYDLTITAADNETFSSNGSWYNLLKYEVLINDTVIFSNSKGPDYRFDFDNTRNAEIQIEFIVENNGYLDIKFYQPAYNYLLNKASGFLFKNITFKKINDEIDELFTAVNEGSFSSVKDIDLDLTDAVGNYTNVIRLEQLNELNALNHVKIINPIYIFQSLGKNLIQVSLEEIITIKDNSNNVEVQQNGVGAYIALTDVEVVYNYFNGEQFVFSYDANALGFVIDDNDVIRVNVKNIYHPNVDRTTWQNWGDAVYPITAKRYGEVLASIYLALHKQAHYNIEGEFNGLFKFSQLIDYKFNGSRIWYPLNLEWNITQGITKAFYSESFYNVAIANNIPPVVYAGPDFSISDNANTTNLLATESDPDGFIVSRIWQVIQGAAVVSSPTLLATNITNMTGNIWQFQITVTDNGGLTASDVVEVIRVLDYSFSKNNITLITNSDADGQAETIEDTLVITPLLPTDFILRLKHTINIVVVNHANGGNSRAVLTIYKNNTVVYNKSINGTENFSVNVELLHISTDQFKYYLDVESISTSGQGETSADISCIITEVVFEQGTGNVVNVPFAFTASTNAQG